jgi:hypothetical protein
MLQMDERGVERMLVGLFEGIEVADRRAASASVVFPDPPCPTRARVRIASGENFGIMNLLTPLLRRRQTCAFGACP